MSVLPTAHALVTASWAVVRGPLLLTPMAAAVVLVAGSWPVLDDGYALMVLRGVGVLLAAAWVVSMDDPMGEVLGASPFPRRIRWGTRMLVTAAVVLPAWMAAALVVEQRASYVPVLAVGLEALGLGAAGLAFAGGLRVWRSHLMPSYLAVVGVVVLALLSHGLPRSWAMTQDQVWGPPWEAAHLRWAAVLLLGVAVLSLVLRDPWAERRRGQSLPFPGPEVRDLGECAHYAPMGETRGGPRRAAAR